MLSGVPFPWETTQDNLECQCNKQSWTLKKKTISILMTTTPERSSLFISLSQRQDDTPERQRCHEFGSLDQTFPRASHRSSIRTECVVDSLGWLDMSPSTSVIVEKKCMICRHQRHCQLPCSPWTIPSQFANDNRQHALPFCPYNARPLWIVAQGQGHLCPGLENALA
jgi:hypothetical protein